jgi:long-chain acyl-CoA synthetase
MLDGTMEAKPWHAHYDQGVDRHIDYADVPISEILARTAKRFPERPAVAFLNAALTYAELDEEVARCANALQRIGVKKGTRVAVQLPNIPQGIIAFHGAARAGAEVVMTNPLYTLREVEHQWKDADVEVAITADFIWASTLRPNRAKLRPTQYVVAQIPEYLKFPLNLLAPLKLKKLDRYAKFVDEEGVHRFKRLVKSTPPEPKSVAVGMEDIAVLQYTGGTTGLSKAAVLTHRNLMANVQQIQGWFSDVREGHEVMLIALPLFHVFGMTVGMNWSIWSGTKMVLAANPRDIPSLVKAITKHRVTLLPAVPAMFNAINNFPGVQQMDLSSVKSCFSGSAPLPIDVQEKFERMTGAKIVEGFGMSETSPVTHVNPLKGTRKSGTVGIPVADTDARIVDTDDPKKVLPVGQEGELIVRGPQVMRGYWNRPDETREVLRDGWMHTGDLAVMDEDGYFRIVGRKKDMINCSGLKVFPDEVDNVLVSHPKILEAATIGVPDAERGETVKSFVVLVEGATMTADEVQAFARENLAAYKIPRKVEFLAELPKSSVMKILRRELRDRELRKG